MIDEKIKKRIYEMAVSQSNKAYHDLLESNFYVMSNNDRNFFINGFCAEMSLMIEGFTNEELKKWKDK